MGCCCKQVLHTDSSTEGTSLLISFARMSLLFTVWKVSVFGLFLVLFFVFGLNTERCRVSLRIKSECGKIRTRKTPNTDTFYAMKRFKKIQLHSDWRTSNDSALQIRLVTFPKFIHLKVHVSSKNVTRCIQNPLKHLRWRFFVEIVNGSKRLKVFAKDSISVVWWVSEYASGNFPFGYFIITE